MTHTEATPATIRPPTGTGSAAYIVQWLNELEECRQGGLISDEEYALERAEKLSELLCHHRHLWLAPVVAAGSLALIAGSAVGAANGNLQPALLAACLAGLFGVIVLTRPFRENLKLAQIRDRLQILNLLLAHDLVSAEEFLIYEERLHFGGDELRMIGNP